VNEERTPILCICPTRERIKKCSRMLESFNATKSGYIDLVFCVDQDDPNIEEYVDLLEDEFYLVIEKQQSITELFNLVAGKIKPDYEIYHTANDDFVYHTKGFDKMVVDSFKHNGSGVYYGDDKYWGRGMAVGPFITSDLVRAVGWLQMPTLMHLCNDTVWTTIADTLQRLYYLPEVVIEHIHPETQGVERDVTSKRVNAPEVYKSDYLSFFQWKKFRMEGDVEKCRGEKK